MDQNIVIIGFGSIGQGLLPLLMQHFSLNPSQLTIITADKRGESEAARYGVPFIVHPLTELNYKDVLGVKLFKGDLLINVSVEVNSLALIRACHEIGALYLDTCIEPWRGGYTDPKLSLAERTNYHMRDALYTLKQELKTGPTAISSHGANPGLVSHWFKQALLNIAADQGRDIQRPQTRQDWAQLAMDLGVRTVHCSERDTQASAQPKERDEFVNTWSVDGFISEGSQPAELGWGTHEKTLPHDGLQHDNGCKAAIYLNQPGVATRVRSWTPSEGPYHGFLITHNEAISIADYFTVVGEQGEIIYRPTVHYAYHPCNDALLSLHELLGRNLQGQSKQRIMLNEIERGSDELGVLVMGEGFGAYWYGSQVSIDQARSLAPHNNATSMQVVAGILGAITWALKNPDRGIVEPEDMCHNTVLEVANPYLGEVKGVYTDWTPLQGRAALFDESVDKDDQWQFNNFRVA